MQLASDVAPKPPSPDRVFEAAIVVPSPFRLSSRKSRISSRRQHRRGSPHVCAPCLITPVMNLRDSWAAVYAALNIRAGSDGLH